MMELRLKIEEGSDMFYTRTDAKNREMGAMHTESHSIDCRNALDHTNRCAHVNLEVKIG